MKKIASILIAVLTVFSLTFTAAAAVNAEPSEFQIKIVHTNDIHARVTENEKSQIIGMEKLKSVIDDYTSDADMDLVLDSGDLFHGQSIATLVQGESIAELAKACGYDAMTAGNHDWSYGKDRLKELAKLAELKMLTGNVVTDDGNNFFDDEFYTEEVTKNGNTLKVGIFGVIDPKIYTSTAPTNVKGLKFTDSVEYAKKAAAELEKQGCDIVIALSHTYNPDELAAKVDGVNLWLCGHEHTDLDTTVTTPNGSTAYVIEDGYYLYQAGLIELDCKLDKQGEVENISCKKTVCDYEKASVYEKNSEVSAVLDNINAQQSVILEKVVGKSPAELDGVWEHLRIDETNLGRAVANAYLLETGADVAFENAGGIRASVKAGDVTYGDIINVSPYGNYIVTKKITGAQLKEILETNIDIQRQCIAANDSGDYDAWPQSSGSYLQSAGMTVEYNPALEQGERVISVKVGGNALDENRLYTVATNNYVAVSKYYPQLANAEEIGEFSACDEALINYFKQDSDKIAADISKAGMIKTDKTSADDSSFGSVTEPATAIDVTNASTAQAAGQSTVQSTAVNDVETTAAADINDSPETGNDSDMAVYWVMLVLSGAIAIYLIKSGKIKQNS